MEMSGKEKDFGILAMEVYFPHYYVSQTELEEFDGCQGKYTIGLGQQRMAICPEYEDINSIALSVLSQLMRRNNISYKNIGRLEVGTESALDMSKSTKSILMNLFKESGNHDVEGIDTINGCYGATNALFNSLQWLESSYWDGRLAIVVATDCAIYPSGSARATGGCGSVAMLVGPNAPLVLKPPRGSFMDHVYDFYKPTLRTNSYPIVDGKLSVYCYMKAMHLCYVSFKTKYEKMHSRKICLLDEFDYIVFHSPYSKIVSKAFSRLLLFDAKMNDIEDTKLSETQSSLLSLYGSMTDEEIYNRFSDESQLNKICKDEFTKYTKLSNYLTKQLGNLYTGSVYISILSLLMQFSSNKKQSNILVFSYGSGCASSMFSITQKDIPSIPKLSSIEDKLNSRISLSPEKYLAHISQLSNQHNSHFIPSTPSIMEPNAYYLQKIEDYQRKYQLFSIKN